MKNRITATSVVRDLFSNDFEPATPRGGTNPLYGVTEDEVAGALDLGIVEAVGFTAATRDWIDEVVRGLDPDGMA